MTVLYGINREVAIWADERRQIRHATLLTYGLTTLYIDLSRRKESADYLKTAPEAHLACVDRSRPDPGAATEVGTMPDQTE